MNKVRFTDQNIKILQNNPHVQRVSQVAITYTDAFKHAFIDECLAGKPPRLKRWLICLPRRRETYPSNQRDAKVN